MEALKDYMTQDDMIDYFQVSDNTIRKWVTHGLKMIKIFDKTYYKKEDIKDFIEKVGVKK